MSVKVDQLSKIYGSQRAVDRVSFEVRQGEVLGFLGPNGAGKTTTMKVITCFIPPTEGEVSVGGFSVRKDPMEVRKRIGYLPEHNPLYRDMYVREYLHFVAGLHKLTNKNKRIAEMIDMTGLGREQNKPIAALSKGYRQRVGLAQAMIHDPDVLILDEPTSGLDPNQLVEIRSLIRQLGKEKTVIFSTHIMQEVQAICDRVVIINKGELVANDSMETLQQKLMGESVVSVQFNKTFNENKWKQLTGVKRAEKLSDHRWKLYADNQADIRPEVFRFAVDQGLILLEMKQEKFSAENVFQQLTAEK